MTLSKERVIIDAMAIEREEYITSIMERIQGTDLSEWGAESRIARLGQLRMNAQAEIDVLYEVTQRADRLE